MTEEFKARAANFGAGRDLIESEYAMKRDMDLIRDMLLQTETSDDVPGL